MNTERQPVGWWARARLPCWLGLLLAPTLFLDLFAFWGYVAVTGQNCAWARLPVSPCPLEQLVVWAFPVFYVVTGLLWLTLWFLPLRPKWRTTRRGIGWTALVVAAAPLIGLVFLD